VANLLFDEARSEVEKIEAAFWQAHRDQRPERLHLEQYRIYSSNGQIPVDKKDSEIV